MKNKLECFSNFTYKKELKISNLILCFCYVFCSFTCIAQDFIFLPHFDNSFSSYCPLMYDELYQISKEIYQKNLHYLLPPTDDHEIYRIPPIMHQIWIGQKLPEKFMPLQKTWLEYHPDWWFLLWVDHPESYVDTAYKIIKRFDELLDVLSDLDCTGKLIVVDLKMLQLKNQNIFNRARCVGEKADMLRYELIYNFGGLYIDVDFECLHNFDRLHTRLDFYAGLYVCGHNIINIALFGAQAGDALLSQCIENISKNTYQGNDIAWKTGVYLFSDCFKKMGPVYEGRIVIFPPSYFYPLCTRVFNAGGKNKAVLATKPETLALHYWAASWLR